MGIKRKLVCSVAELSLLYRYSFVLGMPFRSSARDVNFIFDELFCFAGSIKVCNGNAFEAYRFSLDLIVTVYMLISLQPYEVVTCASIMANVTVSRNLRYQDLIALQGFFLAPSTFRGGGGLPIETKYTCVHPAG